MTSVVEVEGAVLVDYRDEPHGINVQGAEMAEPGGHLLCLRVTRFTFMSKASFLQKNETLQNVFLISLTLR